MYRLQIHKQIAQKWIIYISVKENSLKWNEILLSFSKIIITRRTVLVSNRYICNSRHFLKGNVIYFFIQQEIPRNVFLKISLKETDIKYE